MDGAELNEAQRVVNRLLKLKLGSGWFNYHRYMQVYLRARPLIMIANVSITEQKNRGNGTFTRFLDELEPYYDIHVENVLNLPLGRFLVRRGYEEIVPKWDGPNSYKKLLTRG